MASKTGGGRGTNQHAVKGRSMDRPVPSAKSAADVTASAQAELPVSVPVFRCGSCDDLVEETDGPVYECSRCGGVQVEERRCETCHVFMAKVSDESCPNCEDYDAEFEPVEGWRVQGRVFDTEAAAQEWIDDTPNRMLRQEQARRQLDERLDAHVQKMVDEHTVRQPRMQELRSLVNADQAPSLADTLDWNVERGEIEADWHPSIPMLELGELAALIDEEGTRADRETAGDYGVSYDDRDAANARLRERVRSELPDGPLKERIDPFITSKSGMGLSMDETLDALLPLLRDRQK